MKKLNYLKKIGLVILGLFVIISCNDDENNLKNETILKKEGFVSINLKNKTVKTSSTFLKESSETITYKVSHTFTSNDSSLDFDNVNDMINHINSNPNDANGTYKLYLDNELIYKADIINGIKQNVIIFNPSINNKVNPCSYEGIRLCAVERIDNMNWLDTWTCIADGLGCVLYQMASCAIDNC